MHALGFMLVSRCDVLVSQKPKEARFKSKNNRQQVYNEYKHAPNVKAR